MNGEFLGDLGRGITTSEGHQISSRRVADIALGAHRDWLSNVERVICASGPIMFVVVKYMCNP